MTADTIAIPASATRLANAGRAAGWMVTIHTAVGEIEGRPIESVVVRLTRDTTILCALYENGQFRVGLRPAPLSRIPYAGLLHIIDGGKVASPGESIMVTCPKCHAVPDERCVDAKGKYVTQHGERTAAAS